LEERSDLQLLEAARGGEAAAFEHFYRRHVPLILSYCRRRSPSPETAADLMAESFTAALIAVHDPKRELPNVPIAWLLTIAHRRIADSYRRGRVESSARDRLRLERLDLDDGDIRRIEQFSADVELQSNLERLLSADQFDALRARIFEERSYEEIAGALQCSEAVVRKRLSRAMGALRAALGEAEP
jgi:RNA polymerase sigma-70 factor (ECF subfamily)